MPSEYEVLGEAAVYPGHPVTLALCIVANFDSFEKASHWDQCPAALKHIDIPGAGGCVYKALDLLDRLYRGWDPEEVFLTAEEIWARVDNQKDRRPERWKAGAEQANRFRKKLLKMLEEKWETQKPPSFFRKRDPQTDEEWDELAVFLGVGSGTILKEQTKLADEIMLEIVTEEKEDGI